MRENVVSNLCVPACARIEKLISCPKYGEVGAILNWNGYEIAFFRTDFLEFHRVAWYDAEKFSAKDYHEEVPKEVEESIKKNGGFFLSTKPYWIFKREENTAISSFHAAKDWTRSFFDVPGLKCDLLYGVLYDLLGQWLIETETLTKEEWVNSPTSEEEQQLLLTRDCGGWSLKELLGNIFVKELTQEQWGIYNYVVTRSGVPCTDGEADYPARMRFPYAKSSVPMLDVGVRAFFYFN